MKPLRGKHLEWAGCLAVVIEHKNKLCRLLVFDTDGVLDVVRDVPEDKVAAAPSEPAAG